MSRIGQALEINNLRREVDELKQRQAERERLTENLLACVRQLEIRMDQLEAKRGPGRPRKDE